jgi:hypothetical protein
MSEAYKPAVRTWHLDGENIRDGDGQMVACFCYPKTSTEGRANAAFALKAVMCHADLLAACKQAVYAFEIEFPAADETIAQLKAAIAKATT